MKSPSIELEMNELEYTGPIGSNTYKKRILKWLMIIIAISIVGCLTISLVVGWKLTHPIKQGLDMTPAEYGLTYQDVSFLSEVDNVPLKGWFIPATKSNGLTVVVAHGYKNNRLQDNVPILELVKKLSEKGYNFLLFDFRNSGNPVAIKQQWVSMNNEICLPRFVM